MFVGHFAVGFGAKKFAPRSSLAVLLAAPLLLDLLWPILILTRVEQVRIAPGDTPFTKLTFVSYPWSHSLLMSLVWASLFAAVYYALSRYWPGTIAVWAGVLSHWVLDWITHRADMPLYPDGPKVGLGLWYSIAGTMIVELAMLAVGVWLYVRTTRARDRVGSLGLALYVGVLVAMYFGDRYGPPPPSVTAIGWASIALFVIFLPWAWWVDRHREVPRA